MAKGIGLIGNFKGKVGNMVGYKLTASNTGNTQGVRVYQPIVKNPKTSAQAEQRAKLAPINATYRALKMIIDRGNEGLPYGNKSRLAWLKNAFKAENMPWIEKGVYPAYPVGCLLTKGSLSGISSTVVSGQLVVEVADVETDTELDTIGKISAAFMNAYSFLKNGDQITLVAISSVDGAIQAGVVSFILDITSAEDFDLATGANESIKFTILSDAIAGCLIVSREGANGEHLRSTSTLNIAAATVATAPYDATSKTAAIESYMNSAAVNADWAEESIQ